MGALMMCRVGHHTRVLEAETLQDGAPPALGEVSWWEPVFLCVLVVETASSTRLVNKSKFPAAMAARNAFVPQMTPQCALVYCILGGTRLGYALLRGRGACFACFAE
jgi:hypothetical protein